MLDGTLDSHRKLNAKAVAVCREETAGRLHDAGDTVDSHKKPNARAAVVWEEEDPRASHDDRDTLNKYRELDMGEASIFFLSTNTSFLFANRLVSTKHSCV